MWFALRNLLKHFLLFHGEAFGRKAGEGREEEEEEIGHQHTLRSAGWGCAVQSSGGPGPEERGAPIRSESRGPGPGLGVGWPCGEGKGTVRLNLKMFRGDWGQGPSTLGPRQHVRKPSYGKSRPGFFCLKQLGGRHPGMLQERLEPLQGQAGGPGSHFLSRFRLPMLHAAPADTLPGGADPD